MNLLILTACNKAFRPVGDICAHSLLRYCARHQEIKFSVATIPDDYDRKPSWFKLGLLQKALPNYDYVLWIDSDAMVVGDRDFTEIIQPATLNIARDANGVNNGVAAWANCPEAFQTIARMDSMYEEFKDGPWFEQHALMKIESQIDIFYQKKEVWNAYAPEVHGGGDVTNETMIVHYPGMSVAERVPAMRERLDNINHLRQ